MTGEVFVGEVVPVQRDGGTLAVPGPPDLTELVAGWLLAVSSSDQTARAYTADITQWFNHLERHGVHPLAVTRVHVAGWLRLAERTPTERTGRPPKPATLARWTATVSSFYDYAHAEGRIDRQPVTRYGRPKWPRESSTVGLSRAEASRFLTRLAAPTTPTGERALVTLLILTGCRVSEVIGADIAAVGPDSGNVVFTVVGKGRKSRRVPLAPPAVAAVDAHLAGRAAEAGVPVEDLPRDAPLVVSPAGGRYTQRSIMRIVQRTARAAQIPSYGSLSPHSLRHACLTLMLDQGQPLHVVRDVAGHSSGDTTMRYDRARGALSRGASAVAGLAAYLTDDQ